MTQGNLWLRLMIISTLVACGGSGKNEDPTQNQNNNTNNSFFQFRVDVQGLDGELVLENNGGNAVVINRNGIKDFPSSWTLEGNYNIKIAQEPCLQRCVIDQPEGNISTVGSLTLNVNCASKRWDLPQSEADSMSFIYSEAKSPVLSMNKYGDTILGWFQSDGFNQHVYKREFMNRKWNNLNSIVDHFSFDGSPATQVSLALGDNMDSGIVWSQESFTDFFNIFLGEKTDASWAFSQTALNVTGTTASENKPVIRINSVGEKLVVWSQKVGSQYKLFKAEYRNGAWQMPSDIGDRISVDGTSVEGYDAALNDLGESIIVWSQSNGSNAQVYKAEHRNSSPWTFPTSLSDNYSVSGTDVGTPRVAINNVGDAYIVWHQQDATSNGNFQIFLAETHNGGQDWDDPNSLSDNLTTDNREASYPKVVLNDQGKAAILYRRGDANGVYQANVLTRTDSSSNWVNKRMTVADFSQDQGNMAIDMDEYGNIVAAWSSNTSGNVYKAEYRNDAWLLAEEGSPINSTDSVYNVPAVAVNNCRSAIAWQQEGTLGEKQIFIRQYR